MHIEKCSIETTETRTRAGWMKPDDVALGIGPYYVREAGVVGHYIPVTLTYPAPVQVEGVRVEMTVDEFRALCMVDLRNSGNAKELVLKMREFSIPEAAQPATLPWHDLGPGLSVAVVEGKGAYIARHDPRCGVAYFLKNNGGYVDIDQPPTLAAAKAACDHHAKGGEA